MPYQEIDMASQNKVELFHSLNKKWEEGANREDKPRKLRAEEITVLEELFQQRFMDEELWQKEAHIEELTRAINEGQDLDPVLVIAIKDDFFCIDGHHRIEAYKKADKKTKVPVHIFGGSFVEAWEQSIAGNTKNKLPMSLREKREAAWQMLLTGKFSWSKIVDRTKIGRRTVARMSKCLKELQEGGEEPEALTWEDVLSLARGEERPDFDDDKKEKIVQEWARRFGKTFGGEISKNPTIFAEALEMYSEQAARQVYESLKWLHGEDEDEELNNIF